MQKIPYMLVVGDNEVTENGVNVRKYGEQKSETIALDAFVDMIKVEGKTIRKSRGIPRLFYVI